jgi:organic radical activating enzyme
MAVISAAIPRLGHLKRMMRWKADTLSGRFIERLSAEHMAVEHCNLWCKGCDHSSTDFPAKFSDVESFAADIGALKKVLRVRTFKLVGGEPLLHPDITSLARIVKDSGIAREVQLWTNGLLLHEAPEALFDNVDAVHISRYPGIKIVARKPRMDEISRKHGVPFNIEYKQTFREAHLKAPNHDPARNQEIFRTCRITHVYSCHTIHDGYYFKCSLAEILRRTANIPKSVDGIPLHAPDLRQRLEAYLARKDPLATCAWCYGSTGKSYAHRQLTRTERTRSVEKKKTWMMVQQ